MTRLRQTNYTGFDFSDWLRSNCRDSSDGLTMTDCDMSIYDYKRKYLMFIEVKRRMKFLTYPQERMFSMIDDAMRQYKTNRIKKYCGFHIVQFENTWFSDGRVFVDGAEVSEYDLARILSFDDDDFNSFVDWFEEPCFMYGRN